MEKIFMPRDMEGRRYLNYSHDQGFTDDKNTPIKIVISIENPDVKTKSRDELDEELGIIYDMIRADYVREITLGLQISVELGEHAEITETKTGYHRIASKYLLSQKAAYAASWTYIKKLRRELNNYLVFPSTLIHKQSAYPTVRAVSVQEASKLVTTVTKTIQEVILLSQAQQPTATVPLVDETQATNRIQALIQAMKNEQ
ncbi:MAG: hypothetical protein QXS50_03500 [Candidatus Caldarchaeum sp.]